MKKSKRSLVLCGIIAAFCLGSCLTFTDDLDLNKEISLDMQIGPGGLSIPLGSLDTIYLDSLIKLDGDNSMLDTLDGGLFGFTMKDSVKVDLDKIQPVTIDIVPPSIDPLETSFEKPQVNDVDIPVKENTNTIKIDKIDVSAINSKLPSLGSSFETPEFPVIGTGTSIPVNVPIEITEQKVDAKFRYTFPDDVKKLNKIWFGPEQGSKDGQKLSLDVNLKGIYDLLSDVSISVTNLTITFPSNFTVAKDPGLDTYIPSSCVTASGNVFSIAMTTETISNVGADGMLPVTFFIKSADFSEYSYEIDYNEQVKYQLALAVSGTAGHTGIRNFKVGVGLNAQLQMSEIEAETRSREIEVEEKEISSSCKISGLDGISKVNTITFDSDKSMLYLSISDLGIDPFEFKGNGSSKIQIRFPSDFSFDTDWVKDENGNDVGSWSGTRLTLDATKVLGHTVSLKVQSLYVNETVEGEDKSIEISSDITYSGIVVVAENNDVTLSSLDALTDKELTVRFWGKFAVQNAEVETGELRTDFKDSTVIDIDQMVDPALVMIQRIDLVNPAEASINLLFEGVPQTVEELNFSRFTVEFPEFIKMAYVGGDSRIKVTGSKLVINGLLTDELHSSEGFSVSGLQITGMSFDDPLETVDGRLILPGNKVRIEGSVTVNNQKINNSELDVIRVTPTVNFEPIQVKSVFGKVNPKIDPVDESIDLSLGDAGDFFKNDKNNLSLSNPQLTISLTSTITLPIDIDLNLTSLNADGGYIGKDIKPDMGTIHLPACDTNAVSRTTTLVIYKNERPVTQSDDTIFVRMSRLPELMSTIPDKILFNLKAGANQSVDHFIDLTRPLAVEGEYKVSIPLAFDSLYIEYADTIKDLSKSLEDVADKIETAQLQLLGEISSTIPLGVTLTAKAYDKNWNELNDVRFSSFEIKAGNDTVTKAPMVLDVEASRSGLQKLESIIFTASCESGEEGASIHKGQWLHINRLRIKFPQGLKVDLTDMAKDEKDKH